MTGCGALTGIAPRLKGGIHMDKLTKQHLNDAPWPTDGDFAAMASKRRPRLWPLAIVYWTGVAAGVIATLQSRDAVAGLWWMAGGAAWSLLWLWLLARVLRRQKAWDSVHNQKHYYGRWG